MNYQGKDVDFDKPFKRVHMVDIIKEYTGVDFWEEMTLEHIHPSKAPYGYVRNKDTGHLEIEPIEAQVVKEIFKLCQEGNSTRGIATIMKDNNAYLKTGKWRSDRVYKILTNSIYIGIFEYGKYKRKQQRYF